MVATLAKAATADYYVHSQASFRPPDDYYLSGEEPDGIWWNPSGLLSDGETLIEHGEVLDSAHFYRLYRGLDPFTGEKLTRTADTEKRCPAYDLVFNADKTVSALWAIAPADLRAELEKAHNDAVQTALKETIRDHCSYTRVREDERGHKVVPADIMAALFQHGASRSNDPHLHTHCVIFNLARAHHDGRWRALHGKPLYSWQKAAGATYRAEIAQLLGERLEIEMEAHGDDGEYTRIAGTPATLVEEWSKRDIEITDTASRFGVNLRGNSALHSAIQKMTRAAKQHGVHPDTRHVNWSLDASRHIEDIPAFVESLVGRELDFTEEQKLALARRMAAIPGELTRYQSVFKYPDVVEKVANASAGLLTGERRNAMVEEVLATQSVIELDKPDTSYDAGARLQHGRTFTAAHTIQTERDIHQLTSSLIATERYGIEEATTKSRIDRLIAEDYPIDPEQAEAIHAATAPGQIAVIEGAAGSGKTTTLRPIADLYREAGHDIIATSVSWRVTLELGSDLETDNWCVDKLTVGIANGTIRVGPRTVIVVDEAGQLSSLQALKVLRIAETTGAKIIFAGDTRQQQPVEAGPGLRLILDVAGSTRVDTIRRQKHDFEDMLVALHDVPRASAREAAAAATPAELAAIPGDFDKLPDNRKSDVKPWQVRASEDFRDGKAAAAIAAYHRRGRIHMDSSLDRTLGRIVDDWHRVRTGQPDRTTAVIAHSKVEVRALAHLMRERVLQNYDGPRHVVQACRGRGPRAKPEPLEIAIGDTLRTGAANFRKRLFNGTHLQVLDIREHPPLIPDSGEPRLWIRGRTDRGRIVEFFHDEIRDWHGKIRLDHGYAMTMNAAQGLTVDRAFVFANQKPSRETIYPAATRHRERMDIYIDRAPIELDVRHRRTEDLATEPVTNAEILGYLAANWSRANPEEAAQDYMSEHMRARYIHGDGSAPAAGAVSAEAQAPPPSHRPAASPTSPGRERLPDPERVSTAAWLAANDAGDGRLSEAAAKIRYDEAALKHGVAARTIGQACRRVSASLATWDERRKTEGNAAVASHPRFRTDLREATALLKTAAPFLKHDPLHARILHQHGGIDAGDLKKLADGQRRAISIRDMSVPERRQANPLFTHTAPVKTPEQAAADSIEAVLATLEPSPGPSQTADIAHGSDDGHAEPRGVPTGDPDEPPADLWEGFDRRADDPDIHARDAAAHGDPGYDPEYDPDYDPADAQAFPHPERGLPADPLAADAHAAPATPDSPHPTPTPDPAAPHVDPRIEAFTERWDTHLATAAQAGTHPFAEPSWPAIHQEMRALAALPDIPDEDRRNLLYAVEIADGWLARHPAATHAARSSAVEQPAPGPAHTAAPALHGESREEEEDGTGDIDRGAVLPRAREPAPQPEFPPPAMARRYDDHLERRTEYLDNVFAGGQPATPDHAAWNRLREEGLKLATSPDLPDAARLDLLATYDKPLYLEVTAGRAPLPSARPEPAARRSDPGKTFDRLFGAHLADADRLGLHPFQAPGFDRLARQAERLMRDAPLTRRESANLQKLLDRYAAWTAERKRDSVRTRQQTPRKDESRGMSF